MNSIGIDSWGLDYGLFDATGALSGSRCRSCRDRGRVGYGLPDVRGKLFAITAAQDLAVNTVHQLGDEARREPERHRTHAADDFAEIVVTTSPAPSAAN